MKSRALNRSSKLKIYKTLIRPAVTKYKQELSVETDVTIRVER